MPFVPPSVPRRVPQPVGCFPPVSACRFLFYPCKCFSHFPRYIINRRRFIVKRKAPEIPHNYSWVLLGQNEALSTKARRGEETLRRDCAFPLRPPPLRQYITGLVFCQDFFLIFREFYSVMSSPTVRTLSFCILTCASICVVSHALRLPYAVAMKSFASWRIICRAVS